ncbi:pentatricopeptide repeat-containing protein 2, mitochondrial isoform X2 [Ambystoma mexicanum]|uniref:pentatricopeptide repeat-containing protein 2, mitochondrial isoform X2 n=1 Tax=Ambystoma mexicanum TaxID=8296 RepID=UPI0037E8EA8A
MAAAALWVCSARRALLLRTGYNAHPWDSCWSRPQGDLYFNKIEDKLKKHEPIHKEELKKCLHLCQTAADVELAKNLIHRYHSENSNMANGEFKFGPLFIRLCYELDLAETALELIKDQSLKGFFPDSTSFNILMDMLFTKGHYESALEVLLEMRKQLIIFSRETYILGFAICYKLNRSDSRSICGTLLDEIDVKGEYIPRQAFCFAAALALKRNDVSKAKAIFSRIKNVDSRVCNNLHIHIQTMSGAVENALQILAMAQGTVARNFVKRPEISEQVLAAVAEKVKNNPPLHARFEAIYSKLQASGQITALSLDDMLCLAPHRRKQHPISLNQRKMNTRTFKSLQSTLLAE